MSSARSIIDRLFLAFDEDGNGSIDFRGTCNIHDAQKKIKKLRAYFV